MKVVSAIWRWGSGIVIGLLQIPAFLLLDTALGTSSSYVTVGASVAAFVDPAVRQIEYAAKHLDGAKNWWQVAVVDGSTPAGFAATDGLRSRTP